MLRRSPQGRWREQLSNQLPYLADTSHYHFFASSSSITLMTLGESGLVRGENRATTSPPRPMTNFSKFQVILPDPFGLVSSEVRCLYKSQAPLPSFLFSDR